MRLGKMGADASGWIGGAVELGHGRRDRIRERALDEPPPSRAHDRGLPRRRGLAVAVVDGVEIEIEAGDVLAVEPHEVRTFISSSADYRCFVLHIGDDGTSDKVPVG